MKALVYITPKADILDPQGKAVGSALQDLGYEGVDEVKVGRYVTLQLKSQPVDQAKAQVEDMCRKLLANINVETFRVEITED
ncbi:phosphoribosylformylglycinamidine synthase subunit PurS [bacterium]|nr:phosphoribosylformylglycinamidine synthase subunit PurS [bacterium]MBU1653113.1 phosphoribosylformylglycinamidine synthase subunit PurS [bacterium]MBU1882238.1 phosphoribosylformylglycinamidine synthase subunit PurS [bacterium]